MQLGKLIALYDDNHITIDGDTAVSFTEDVVKRFEAYGWHVQIVSDGDHDMQSIQQAIEKAKTVTDKPSLIKVHTTIGFGSLNEGQEKVHGAALERKCNTLFHATLYIDHQSIIADDIRQLKQKFGFNPDEKYVVPPEVSGYQAGYINVYIHVCFLL